VVGLSLGDIPGGPALSGRGREQFRGLENWGISVMPWFVLFVCIMFVVPLRLKLRLCIGNNNNNNNNRKMWSAHKNKRGPPCVWGPDSMSTAIIKSVNTN
jgi:hypothetical protein